MKLDLILKNTNELTNEQHEFVNLHTKLQNAVLNTTLSIYEMCNIIKTINDSKLYLTVGYDTLEEYTMEYFSIKKSQAYNYIKIAETYSEEFFQLTGKNIGVSKLLILSKISEEDAYKYVEENDISNKTVKELENEISELKKINDANKLLIDGNNKMLSDKDNIIHQLQLDIESLQSDPGCPEIKEIIKEVPIIDDVKIKELQTIIDTLEDKNKKLTKKYEKAKNDNSKKELEEVLLEKEKLTKDLEELNKKYLLASNNDFNDFKNQFRLLENVFKDTLYKINNYSDELFKGKCYIALKSLFKVVLEHE